MSFPAQIPKRRESVGGFGIFHGTYDGFADNFRRNCPSQILIRDNVPDRHGIDAVPIGGGVHGIDGPGITVMGHAGDLAQLRLVEVSICEDNADRGIAGE